MCFFKTIKAYEQLASLEEQIAFAEENNGECAEDNEGDFLSVLDILTDPLTFRFGAH